MYAAAEDGDDLVPVDGATTSDETWRERIREPSNEVVTLKISTKQEGAKFVRGMGRPHFLIPRSVKGGNVNLILYIDSSPDRLRGKSIQVQIGLIWKRKAAVDGDYHLTIDLHLTKNPVSHEFMVWPVREHCKRSPRTVYSQEVPGTNGMIEIRKLRCKPKK